MPFDGSDFGVHTGLDTGLFPIWSKHGFRHWIEGRFGRKARANPPRVIRHLLSPAERGAAIAQLLEDAKRLLEDPKDWTRGRYETLHKRRCAVGALRAAARRLDGPSPAWAAHELLIKIARSRGFSSVEGMNDHSS